MGIPSPTALESAQAVEVHMSTMTEEERGYYALVLRAFEKLAPVYDLMTLPASRLRRIRGRVRRSSGRGKSSGRGDRHGVPGDRLCTKGICRHGH